MQNILIILSILSILLSCDKKEENLQAINAEVFAFDLGSLWEVNSIVQIKGVKQIKDNNLKEYISILSVSIDLVHPDNKVEQNKFTFTDKQKNYEQLPDIKFEAQFTLDSTYQAGNYKIIFNIIDLNSGNSTSIDKELILIK